MGFSRRILILWSDNVFVDILDLHPQVILMRYFDFLAKTIGESWVIEREFNLILELSEWACGVASVSVGLDSPRIEPIFHNVWIGLYVVWVGVDLRQIAQDSERLQDRELELWQKIKDVLKHEELLWFQKSRTEWLTSGDRNTRYFYSRIMASRKKIRLKVLKLKMRNGVLMRSSFNNMWWIFFKDPYSMDYSISGVYPYRRRFPLILLTEKVNLLSRIGDEEICKTVSAMAPWKALGVNGFHAK
ncbi:hypothetical protein Golob_021807, partial [Gossypium lobatum]|nr:hypothetical protein [Gossypium lobatum]